MENKLLLGVARKIISPAVGGQLFGYSPDVFSESLHDDLTATAFYFEQGGVKALMLSATICSWQSELADRIVQTIEARSGIPATHCILHATHTHSGPNVTGSYGWCCGTYGTACFSDAPQMPRGRFPDSRSKR